MTYVHEEVEREAEGEEAVGEGADGGERAEVERQNEDVGARALAADARPHVLRCLHVPRRDHHPRPALRQHPRRLRPYPGRRACMTNQINQAKTGDRSALPALQTATYAPVMMAVMQPRSGQTSSAVDLEPKPLAPGEPSRYFAARSISASPPIARAAGGGQRRL